MSLVPLLYPWRGLGCGLSLSEQLWHIFSSGCFPPFNLLERVEWYTGVQLLPYHWCALSSLIRGIRRCYLIATPANNLLNGGIKNACVMRTCSLLEQGHWA